MFDVPDSPKQYVKELGNFLGVDYTSIEPNERRATNMINLVNNDGYLETRPGYNEVLNSTFGTKATLTTSFGGTFTELTFTSIRAGVGSNSIKIKLIKPATSNSTLKLVEKDKVVEYYLATDTDGNISTKGSDIIALNSKYVTVTAVDGTKLVNELTETNLTGGVNARINGVWNFNENGTEVFIIHVKDKLYKTNSSFTNHTQLVLSDTLNDVITQYSAEYIATTTGPELSLIIFDGKRTIMYGKYNNVYGAYYIDATTGYVPRVSINRKPDGTGATNLESPNLLSPYRTDSFVSDGTSTTYKLAKAYDNEKPTAKLLQSDGSYSALTISSWSNVNATVTFNTAPGVFPVAGRDSVFITYKVSTQSDENYYPDLINKCTLVTTFGYNGNNNRLFVSGNPDYPNADWYSQYEDGLYFPSKNFTKIGFESIQNYLKLNDGTLAVQKKTSDTDFTMYYRTSSIYNGSEVFPIQSSVKSLGCIGKYANSNLVNDPITLTEMGIYGVKGSSYGEKFAMERSYFIKEKLLDEPNLENAVGITYNNKYYLAINNHVYVADSRYRTKVTEANASDYQYEWYYWENVPVRIWFTYEDELYFGTESGDICKFNDTCLDYNFPINVLYDTAFLDLGSISQSKTVKRITVISRPYEDSEYTLSYITNEDTQQITDKQTPEGDFPATLQEKEKIKKIMFVKFRLHNNTEKKMNFYRIALEYIYSKRYRGD